MPWDNSREKRAADAKVYGTPEYRRNREAARKRANGHCEVCHHRHSRLEFDARTPVSQGGDHGLDNGRMICKGPGTCQCHDRKTAQEGGGYRRTNAPPDPPLQGRTSW